MKRVRMPVRMAVTVAGAALGLLAAAPAMASCAPVTVFFGWNSARLNKESQAAIERLAVALAWKGPDLDQVLLTSHTDSSGSPAANRAMALRRAAAVRDLLTSYHIPTRLITILVASDDSPRIRTGRNVREAYNRRVELVLQMSAASQGRQLEQGAPIC